MSRRTNWSSAIELGSPVEDFHGVAVHKGLFHDFKLSHLRGSYVVLLFYPLSFNTLAPSVLPAQDVPRDALNFRQRCRDFREAQPRGTRRRGKGCTLGTQDRSSLAPLSSRHAPPEPSSTNSMS